MKMKQDTSQKVVQNLDERFRALEKRLEHPTDVYALLDISAYVSHIKNNALLKKIADKLLKTKSNDERYSKDDFGYSFDKLEKVYDAVTYKKNKKVMPEKEAYEKIRKDSRSKQAQSVYHRLFQEFQAGTYNKNNPFPQEDYLWHLRRVHKAIREQQDKNNAKKKTPKFKKFDELNQVLVIGDFEISFPYSKRGVCFQVLRARFDGEFDIDDDIEHAELEAKATIAPRGASFDMKLRRRYDKIYRRINDMISKGTDGEINDFFDFDTRKARINRKYL